MTPLTEPLLTADQAAELLAVSRKHVYEMVRSQGLPHVLVGERALRFIRADLAGWVDQHRRGRRAEISPETGTNKRGRT